MEGGLIVGREGVSRSGSREMVGVMGVARVTWRYRGKE